MSQQRIASVVSDRRSGSSAAAVAARRAESVSDVQRLEPAGDVGHVEAAAVAAELRLDRLRARGAEFEHDPAAADAEPFHQFAQQRGVDRRPRIARGIQCRLTAQRGHLARPARQPAGDQFQRIPIAAVAGADRFRLRRRLVAVWLSKLWPCCPPPYPHRSRRLPRFTASGVHLDRTLELRAVFQADPGRRHVCRAPWRSCGC